MWTRSLQTTWHHGKRPKVNGMKLSNLPTFPFTEERTSRLRLAWTVSTSLRTFGCNTLLEACCSGTVMASPLYRTRKAHLSYTYFIIMSYVPFLNSSLTGTFFPLTQIPQLLQSYHCALPTRCNFPQQPVCTLPT